MRTTRWLFCSHNKLRQICPYFKTYSESIGSESKTSLAVSGVSAGVSFSLSLVIDIVSFFDIVTVTFSDTDRDTVTDTDRDTD